jgi:hypothetical protein
MMKQSRPGVIAMWLYDLEKDGKLSTEEKAKIG